jgi:hypothetical protein
LTFDVRLRDHDRQQHENSKKKNLIDPIAHDLPPVMKSRFSPAVDEAEGQTRQVRDLLAVRSDERIAGPPE